MKKLTIYLVVAALCLNFNALGQNITPIKFGEKIPDDLWQRTFKTVNGDGSKGTFKLADHSGKLIVLDFWATWCSACIEGFSKVEALQHKFPVDLKPILVNYDESIDKVKEFFVKRSLSNIPVGLSSIVADSILSKYFPAKLIPHYVWISKDGYLLTTTSSLKVDEPHVKRFLNNNVDRKEAKIDIDIERPLFSNEFLPLENIEQSSLLIKGYFIEGAGSSTHIRYTDGIPNGVMFTNNSILDFFEYCFFNIDKTYSRQRLILEVTDTTKLIPPANASLDEQWKWHLKNDYSYDFMVPKHKAYNLYQLILNNLNAYSSYEGYLAKKIQKTLVITGIDDKLLTNDQGDKFDQIELGILTLRNASIEDLKNRLNSDLYFGLTSLNESGINDKINVRFDHPIRSFQELTQQLKKHGFKFKILNREVSEFKIRDKNLES